MSEEWEQIVNCTQFLWFFFSPQNYIGISKSSPTVIWSQSLIRDCRSCLHCGWNSYKQTKVLAYIGDRARMYHSTDNFPGLTEVKLYLCYCAVARNECKVCPQNSHHRMYAVHAFSEICALLTRAIKVSRLLMICLSTWRRNKTLS